MHKGNLSINHRKNQQWSQVLQGPCNGCKQSCHLLFCKQPITLESSSHVVGQPNASRPLSCLFPSPRVIRQERGITRRAASLHIRFCWLGLAEFRLYSSRRHETRCGKSNVMAAASNTITAAVATMALLSPDCALPVCRPAPHTMHLLRLYILSCIYSVCARIWMLSCCT